MKFGKIDIEGNLEYAPNAYKHNGIEYWHPTPDDYKAVGYLLVVQSSPSTPAPSGYHYVPDGWEVVDEEIHNKWKLVEDPHIPRTFSKMKIVAALTRMDAWEQTKEWIESQGLYDLYLAAQDFAEDNDYFDDGVKAIKDALQLTDEQVEEILSQCVLEN